MNIVALESLLDYENDKLTADMKKHKEDFLKRKKCDCKVVYMSDGTPLLHCIHYNISRGKRFFKRARKLLNVGMFLSAATFEGLIQK